MSRDEDQKFEIKFENSSNYLVASGESDQDEGSHFGDEEDEGEHNDFDNKEYKPKIRRKRGRPRGSKNKISPMAKRIKGKKELPKCFSSFVATKEFI